MFHRSFEKNIIHYCCNNTCKMYKKMVQFRRKGRKSMKNEEYILNEVGLEIARENIAKKMVLMMKKRDEKDFKSKLQQLFQDRDKIEKGNIETIKKYVGEWDVE